MSATPAIVILTALLQLRAGSIDVPTLRTDIVALRG